MGITQLNPKGRRGIDTSVHACQDEVLLGRGESKVAICETGRVLLGRGLDILLDGAHFGCCGKLGGV